MCEGSVDVLAMRSVFRGGAALLLFLFLTAQSACSIVEDETDAQAAQLYGHTWTVEEVAGEPAASGVEAFLVVEPDGKVSGNGGCNGYFGSVIIDGSAMSFGNLGGTRMACPEPAMGQETRLLKALDSTRGYRLQDGGLVLLDGAGVPLARFRSADGG